MIGAFTRRFEIETSLSPAEVQSRLRAPALFEGLVEESKFDFVRTSRGRNSFRPRVRGAIEKTQNGARLSGTMTIHAGVLVFMAIWLLGAGYWSVLAIQDVVAGGPSVTSLIPVIMLMFGLIMLTGGFALETRRTMRMLSDALQTQ